MPKHSSDVNIFKATVNRTSQRYVLTFPRPMGDSKLPLEGFFMYSPENNEIIFTVANINDPLMKFRKE